MQVLFFVFLIFFVRRSIDILHPENQHGSGSVKIWDGSGSRALQLTENVWHQKYENKKEDLQNYLEFSFKSILNISYRSGYRALDPKFCQNRILIPDLNTWTKTKLLRSSMDIVPCHMPKGLYLVNVHMLCPKVQDVQITNGQKRSRLQGPPII